MELRRRRNSVDIERRREVSLLEDVCEASLLELLNHLHPYVSEMSLSFLVVHEVVSCSA